MSGNEDVRILLAHIDRHIAILDEIAIELNLALEQDVPALGRTNRTGVMVGAIIESYYNFPPIKKLLASRSPM